MLADASIGNELRGLLAEPLAVAVFATTAGFAVVPMLVDRSRYRPGNFAPIQLISAIGAWALLLLNEAILVSSVRALSPIVACGSFATLLTTLWLFRRHDHGRVVNDRGPDTIDAMLREIEQILRSAWRVGIASLNAVIVQDTGPFVGVSVSRPGYVVVRVRQELLAWLARHRRHGGAGPAAVESLLRFTVLHELGHVLNGDHLTYRFVRSVLLAHLCWIPVGLASAAMLPWDVPGAETAVTTALCFSLLFLSQCLLARRFLAEREEVADLRAMQTLDPSDASLLATRRGRRTDRPNPTLLEKLMTDLQVQGAVTRRAGWWSKAVQWVWPEAGHIHERCELLALGRGGRRPRPTQWAAFVGMQCGLLCIALLACASTAFSALPFWQPGVALRVAVILMAVTCSTAATYCGMRVGPAFVRLHALLEVPRRWTVGAIFYLSFSASAFMAYLLPVSYDISAVLSYPLFLLSLGLSAAQVIFGSVMAADDARSSPETATISLRHPLLYPIPVFLMHLSIVICCGAAAVWTLCPDEIGSRVWGGVSVVAWAGVMTSYFFGRSTNAAVRAIPPTTVLDSPGRVYAIRVFWRELYFDRHITSQGFIIFVDLSTYAASTLMFACGAALASRLMSHIAADDEIRNVLFLMSGVLVVLMQLAPRRATQSAHLTDLEHLRMFDNLLTAVRTAKLPVAEELSDALARWVHRDADILSLVLPKPRAIWKLESLLLLVRIVRKIEEEKLLARWRPAIATALGRIVIDGAVFVNRSRPSLAYTVLAAQVIEEAGLTAEFPLEPILDSVAERLELHVNGEERASAEAVASACRLLNAHGRAHPAAEGMRMEGVIAAADYYLAHSTIRARLRDLVAYISLMENTALDNRLTSIARARMWETLQMNPWNDVPVLLDCYLAAVSLGERNSPRLSPAQAVIGEVATRMTNELTKIYGAPDRSGNEVRS